MYDDILISLFLNYTLFMKIYVVIYDILIYVLQKLYIIQSLKSIKFNFLFSYKPSYILNVKL